MHSEDDDFTPYPSSSSSKKLASLFEKINVPAGGNSSLMYKAPKQPRSQKQQKSLDSTGVKSWLSSNDTNVIILVATVQAFKFENNEYNSEGKVGAAIVFRTNYNQYQLILYKEKSEYIAQAVLNAQFWFTVQQNNYATFYDKHKIMWSILFESSDSAVEFITQIAIAKWNSEGKSNLSTQDLVVVENDRSVECGCFVDVSCTATVLLSDNKLDKKVVSNENERVHIVSNMEPGVQTWETALIGMSVGCKRLIMLPGSQLGRWKKYIPDSSKNCNILLTVHVNQIENSDADKKLSSVDSSVEQNVKSKSESIQDALTTSSNSSRASLISRMAKMGQATLPFKGARVATSGISDSSETEEDGLSAASLSDSMVKSSTSNNPKTSVKPHSQPAAVQLPSVTSQPSIAPIVSVPSASYQQPVANSEGGGNSVAVTRPFTYDGSFIQPSTFAAGNFATAPDPQVSVFLSELRTHNSELRMNINRVSDKVDRVIDKVDNVDPVNKILEQLQSMEQNILSQFSLMNQQSNEVNNAIKKTGIRLPAVSASTESNDEYDQLKKENMDLLASLSQSRNKLNELQIKLDHLESLKLELQKQLVNEKENRKSLEKEHLLVTEKLKARSHNQEKIAESLHLLADKTSSTILQLEKKIEEKQKGNSNDNEDDIKKVMRSVFKNILQKFPRDSTIYSTSEIHSALAEVIKASTFEYLQSKTISNNNNTINKVSTSTYPVPENAGNDANKEVVESAKKTAMEESIADNLTKEGVESVKKIIDQNEGNDLKESENKDGDNKEILANKSKSLIEDSVVRGNSKSDEVLRKTDDTNVLEEHKTPDLSAVVKGAGDQEDKLNVKSCVTEFLKMKDEIGKTLQNDSQKDITCANKDGCNIDDTRQGREVSPCSSVRSSATNDTADENWRSQPPPLLCDEDDRDTDDDWLKM